MYNEITVFSNSELTRCTYVSMPGETMKNCNGFAKFSQLCCCCWFFFVCFFFHFDRCFFSVFELTKWFPVFIYSSRTYTKRSKKKKQKTTTVLQDHTHYWKWRQYSKIAFCLCVSVCMYRCQTLRAKHKIIFTASHKRRVMLFDIVGNKWNSAECKKKWK